MISNVTRYPILIIASLLASAMVMFAALERALDRVQAF
jgi:hypothetical protein